MASSRRRPPVEAPIAALRDVLARIDANGPVLVAFSGGLDSTVLLHAAADVLGAGEAGSEVESRRSLLAIHVDHGLQAPSADWARHCVGQSDTLGVDCRVVRLEGAPQRGESVESWAREARYAAFAGIAEEVGAAALLTAHHADDQIETFLLRLVRGAGLDGLVSIEPDTMRGGLRVLRPFLGLPRSALERWARSRGLAWIEDPSNRDERLLRNAVRRQLVPVLDRVLPALRQRLPQTLAALREERDRLRELDRRRLETVTEPSRSAPGRAAALSLCAWRRLPAASRAGVLRQWLALHGARMPSRARLAEMLRQLDAPAADGLEIRHDGFVLRRYRGQAMLLPAAERSCEGAASGFCLPLRWVGERRVEVPELAGVLTIERIGQVERVEPVGPVKPVGSPGRPGLAERWLQAPDLELRARSGGERLRMHPGGPHRSLKKLYQERGVPSWARRALPVLWAHGRPVWAAGIGCDADCIVSKGVRYALDWQPLRRSRPASAPERSQH